MVNRYSVAPLGGLDVGAKMTNIIEGGRQQNRLIKWNKTAPAIIKGGNPREIADLMAKYPEMQPQIAAASGYEDAALLKESVDLSKEILTGTTDPKQALAMHIQQGQARGEDVTRYLNLLGRELSSPGAIKKWAGNWTAMHDPVAFGQYNKLTGTETSELNVKSSEILEDGTIIQSTTTGPVVYDPDGNLVKGKKASAAIRKGRSENVKNQKDIYEARRRGTLETDLELRGDVEADVISRKESAKISTDAFTRLENIDKNIRNIDEGIKLIDEGAETGVIDTWLPSVRAASLKLDNLQYRLGLDVLSTTTFGALSEKELEFALKTALPDNLQPKDLRKWLVDKKSAQTKLATYLKKSAKYLEKHTVSEWLDFQDTENNKLPEGVTKEDVALTMKNNNMTREEVLTRLKGGQ